jgi:hypothetical protein
VCETSWTGEHFRGRVEKHVSRNGNEGITSQKRSWETSLTLSK